MVYTIFKHLLSPFNQFCFHFHGWDKYIHWEWGHGYVHVCKSPVSMFVWKMHNLNFQKLPFSKGFHSRDYRTNIEVVIAVPLIFMKLEINCSLNFLNFNHEKPEPSSALSLNQYINAWHIGMSKETGWSVVFSK